MKKVTVMEKATEEAEVVTNANNNQEDVGVAVVKANQKGVTEIGKIILIFILLYHPVLINM
jgi:hypothetical protein